MPTILSPMAVNWLPIKLTIWSVVRDATCVDVKLATLLVVIAATCDVLSNAS